MGSHLVFVAVVTMLVHQVCSLPWGSNDLTNNPDTPKVGISHQMICRNAVTELARDATIAKRDDTFINLVVNLCFPEVDDPAVLLQLIATIAGQLPVATTQAPWEDEWHFGLLPEVHSGQEGIDGNDVNKNFDEDAELIGGLPAELGPGQEGIDAGGYGGEDTGDVPDEANWWGGEFVDDGNTNTDNRDSEVDNAPSKSKKDRLFNLISFVLNNMFDEEANDIISQFDNNSGPLSSSSSSSEEEEPVTSKATTKVTTQVKTEQPTTVKVTTQPPTTVKVTTQPPSTVKVTTQPPTTKVATETVTTKVTEMKTPTAGATQPPLPTVNPNKKKSEDELILELLLRYAQEVNKESENL